MHRLMRRGKKQPTSLGQILVEAAIALPVFFLLVFGTLEVGKIIFRKLQVSYAAYTVTRMAVVNDGQYIPEALRQISPRLDTQFVAIHPIYDAANDFYWVTLEYKGPGTWRTIGMVPEHTFPIIEAAGMKLGSSRNRHDTLTYRGSSSFPGYNGGTVTAVQYEMSRPIAQFAAWETRGQKTGLAGNGVVRRWRPPTGQIMGGFRGWTNVLPGYALQGGWSESYAWKHNTLVATSAFTPRRNPEWGLFQFLLGIFTSPYFIGHLMGKRGLQGNPEFIATLYPTLTGALNIQDPLNLIHVFLPFFGSSTRGWNPYAEYPLARGSMGAAYGQSSRYAGYVWSYFWYGQPPVAIPKSPDPMPWQYWSYAMHRDGGWDGFMMMNGVGTVKCIKPLPKGGCALWDNEEPGFISGSGWSGRNIFGGGGRDWNFYLAAFYTAQQVELVNNAAVHPYTFNIGNDKFAIFYFFDDYIPFPKGDPWAPGQGTRNLSPTGCLDGPCRNFGNPVINMFQISNYDAHVDANILDEKEHGFHWSYTEPRNDHTDPSPGWSH